MNTTIADTKTYGTKARALALADAENVTVEIFKTKQGRVERLEAVALTRDNDSIMISANGARATWLAVIAAMRNFDI